MIVVRRTATIFYFYYRALRYLLKGSSHCGLFSSTTAMPFDGTRLIYLGSIVRPLNPSAIRYASQHSAIRKGLLAERRLAALETRANPTSRMRQDTRSSKTRLSTVKAERPIPKSDDLWSVSPLSVSPDSRRRKNHFTAQSSYESPNDTKTSKTRREQSTEHVKPETGSKRMAKQEKKTLTAPHSLPFTTAASEFLYGHSTVIAALKANRRKLYKLYLHPRAKKESGSTETIEQLCLQSGVTMVDVDNRWLQAMDKVTDGRPHNVRCS